jgi:protein-S-isoprenylcysteine O-methyltransferase Ste14
VNQASPAYGLWTLVILNSAVFILFAFSFSKPTSARDWRSFGAFAAFIVALFVEMWSTLMGSDGDPHASALHIASYVLLGAGFWLLSSAWNVLYHAQRRDALTVTGAYARMRHPQYVAFVLILLGFLLQWPTLLSLAMFPILLVMYARLAMREEAELRERFGEQYEAWAARTPRFVPARHPSPPEAQRT